MREPSAKKPAMARERALEIAASCRGFGPVTVTRFFGGAGLMADGVQFGLVLQGSLYLRVDAASRPAFEACGAAPFAYAGRLKQVTVASYYEAPGEVVEEPERLGDWLVRAHRAALAARRPLLARDGQS